MKTEFREKTKKKYDWEKKEFYTKDEKKYRDFWWKKKKDFSQKPSKPKSSRYKNYAQKDVDLSQLEKIVWVYSQAKNNDFWFVDVEWKEKGYFVYPKNLNGALDGDQVEAVLQTFNRRQEAIITKVIKRAERVLVGKLELVKDFAFVVLDNPAFKTDVHITSKNLSKIKKQLPLGERLKNGDKVAIKITTWEGKNPEGSIVQFLWDELTPGVDILGIALEMGARIAFPEYVLQEASNLKFEKQNQRVDLTNELIFTIDGEDAKDLDDAVGVKKVGENYILTVSIADVAEYVTEGSGLDKEALKRGNSTYLVDRVIPMLPEKLSNDLCSLNPNTKKLTLTCEMKCDTYANVIEKKVYESVISSKYRLTYREVQEMLNGDLNVWDALKFGGMISDELLTAVKLTLELKEKITARKTQKWILNFDFPETKIKLDEERKPVSIEKYERYESMKIIEEFMILANESVGELYAKLPFVYRIHPLPDEDDIEKLRNTLAIFGVTLPHKTITPKTIADILESIEGNPKEKLLQKLILRSLEKAVYSVENDGHFGLNLEYYSHFTSPIRRYPDLQIHRIIKEKLHNNFSPERLEHYKNILPAVCKKTSDTERNSEKMEYAVRDLMICKYYESRIGQKETWVISGMIESGFFVELENTAEWFVSIEQVAEKIGKKRYNYVPEYMKFEFSQELSFQIWDQIEIEISSVEMERRRLNFDFLQKTVQ